MVDVRRASDQPYTPPPATTSASSRSTAKGTGGAPAPDPNGSRASSAPDQGRPSDGVDRWTAPTGLAATLANSKDPAPLVPRAQRTVGTSAPASTPTGDKAEGLGDATQRYGNFAQQPGGGPGVGVTESESALTLTKGDPHGGLLVATTAVRTGVPVSIGDRPVDVEAAMTSSVAGHPAQLGVSATVHAGPAGDQKGVGAFVTVGHLQTEQSGAQDARGIPMAAGGGTATSTTASALVVDALAIGSKGELDVQAFGSLQDRGQVMGRPAVNVGVIGASVQYQHDVGAGFKLGIEAAGMRAGTVASAPGEPTGASNRTVIGVGGTYTRGPVSASLWVERQTESGGGGPASSIPSVTAGVGVRWK